MAPEPNDLASELDELSDGYVADLAARLGIDVGSREELVLALEGEPVELFERTR
jgi:hypothetical protein